MPISPARQTAYQILRRVESGRRFAVDLLQSPQVSRLCDADRRLTTELVMGVLRWRGELDYRIEQLSGKPLTYFDAEVATILRLGIYQIRFLEKVPKSSVVNEAVSLTKAVRKRSAAGLVNAVLRKCEPLAHEAGRALDEGLAAIALRSMPTWLRARWEKQFGLQVMKALALASTQIPPTVLRVAGPAVSREDIRQALHAEGVETRPGYFSERALVVSAGNIQKSASLAEGRVVIQDEASQAVGALVRPLPGQRVLDLCAAPGVKAGQLAAALGEGTLVACDLSARRLRTMVRLLRGRIPSAVRLHAVRLDATKGLPFACRFDRILVDAPCSGTGTLARNPEIKLRLRSEDVARLAGLQVKMLRNALSVLAPGGRLTYATCSLEPEENEQVVEGLLAEAQGYRTLTADELCSEFPQFSPLFDARGYFRTRPDLHRMDGFFAAVILRTT